MVTETDKAGADEVETPLGLNKQMSNGSAARASSWFSNVNSLLSGGIINIAQANPRQSVAKVAEKIQNIANRESVAIL